MPAIRRKIRRNRRRCTRLLTVTRSGSQLREVDLVGPHPVQLAAAADLGADVLQEVAALRSEPIARGRGRRFDEAGGEQARERGGAFALVGGVGATASATLLGSLHLQQDLESIDSLAQLPRITEKIAHGPIGPRSKGWA